MKKASIDRKLFDLMGGENSVITTTAYDFDENGAFKGAAQVKLKRDNETGKWYTFKTNAKLGKKPNLHVIPAGDIVLFLSTSEVKKAYDNCGVITKSMNGVEYTIHFDEAHNAHLLDEVKVECQFIEQVDLEIK